MVEVSFGGNLSHSTIPQVLSQAAYEMMKDEFLKAYDENEDGRIEIGEVRKP